MAQERQRQQHAKELEEKDLDLESFKASMQKKVCIIYYHSLLCILHI